MKQNTITGIEAIFEKMEVPSQEEHQLQRQLSSFNIFDNEKFNNHTMKEKDKQLHLTSSLGVSEIAEVKSASRLFRRADIVPYIKNTSQSHLLEAV